MKKLLFLLVVGFGGSMLIKGNYVTISPTDNQVRVAGWVVPLPASVQSSPVMAMVSTMLQGNLGPPAASAPQARPGAPVQPALPSVTSALGTYNTNAPRAAQTPGSDQFNATAKALR
jgi:hypothetical protein